MSYISDYIYDYSSDYMYDYSYDPTHSHNQIIILINYKKDNLYGYGRKWWMPEWYLAYSDGIWVYIYMCIYMLAESYMSLLILPTGSRGMELL